MSKTIFRKKDNMNDNLNKDFIDFLIDGELGENVANLIKLIDDEKCRNKVLIDLGVESGKSSKVLLHKAQERNNRVFGVDPIMGIGIDGIMNHPNYTFLKKDSVSVGAEWLDQRPFIVFVDSVHAKEQVLRELYYWWDLVEVGGWIVFHDTQWEGYIHKWNHSCAGKKAGNTGLGYDFYLGKAWETPDKAVKAFFNIADLNYEDDIIKSTHFPTSLGMTFIQKKKENNYKSNISNWPAIESERQRLLSCFK